jgi:hypothetical protein
MRSDRACSPNSTRRTTRTASPRSTTGSRRSTPTRRPARAARILAGLGFDEAAQAQPLSVVLRRLAHARGARGALFAEPDLLLLDEPTNHLDLEASDVARGVPQALAARTLIVVSHERDLLNNVATTSCISNAARPRSMPAATIRFERQRRERHGAAQAAARQAGREAPRSSRPISTAGATRRTGAPGAEPHEGAGEDGADRRASSATTRRLAFDLPESGGPLKPPLISLDGARRLHAGPAGARAAQSAHRSRRPRGAGRPQRQRQDDAGKAALRPPEAGDGWRGERARAEAGGRLLRAAPDRGDAARPETPIHHMATADAGGVARRRCARNSAASASPATRPTCR